MLPQIINNDIVITEQFPLLDQREMDYIEEAAGRIYRGGTVKKRLKN